MMVSAGDTVVFNFQSGAHNVYSFPSMAAFNACQFANAEFLSDSGNYQYLVTETPGTVLWFGCDIANHCAAGIQKLQVTVQ